MLLAVFLPLTLGWKWVATSPDPENIRSTIVGFLADHQFTIAPEREFVLNIPIVRASAGDCRILVGNVSPYGVDKEVAEHLGGASDRRLFVFGGKTYDRQPIVQTTLNYLWSKLLLDLGVISTIPPVLVAISSSCAAEEPPWNSLAF